MARIVIATSGSRGDVLPFIALAHGLPARGHAVRIAVSANHARLATGAGCDHIHVRPKPSRHMLAERNRGEVPDIRRLLAEVIAPGIAEGHAALVAAWGWLGPTTC